MSKFKKFILEGQDQLSDITDIINSQCQPFLKDLRSTKIKKLMYSGRRHSSDYFIKSVRQDRKPVDSDIEIHTIMDDLFLKKFGFKARSNAIFTIGDAEAASQYGGDI